MMEKGGGDMVKGDGEGIVVVKIDEMIEGDDIGVINGGRMLDSDIGMVGIGGWKI